jgi:hypothetical protein
MTPETRLAVASAALLTLGALLIVLALTTGRDRGRP